MKSNKIINRKNIFILFIFLFCISVWLVNYSFAKYVTLDQSENENAGVAEFKVATDFNVSTSFEEVYTIDVYPGDQEEFIFSAQNLSEVLTNLTIRFEAMGTLPVDLVTVECKKQEETTWNQIHLTEGSWTNELINDGNTSYYNVRIKINEQLDYKYAGTIISIKMVVTIAQA